MISNRYLLLVLLISSWALRSQGQGRDSVYYDWGFFHQISFTDHHKFELNTGLDVTHKRPVPALHYESPSFIWQRRIGLGVAYDHLRNPGFTPDIGLIHRVSFCFRTDRQLSNTPADWPVKARLGASLFIGDGPQGSSVVRPALLLGLDFKHHRFHKRRLGAWYFWFKNTLNIMKGGLWYEPDLGVQFYPHESNWKFLVPGLGYRPLLVSSDQGVDDMHQIYLMWRFYFR